MQARAPPSRRDWPDPQPTARSARDLATGKEQSITVNATGTLSDEEINRIIEENELYEVELKG